MNPPTSPRVRTPGSTVGRYVRGLLPPLIIWSLVAYVLVRPLQTWLRGQDLYDQHALREWLNEARGFRDTLPEMVDDYLHLEDERKKLDASDVSRQTF